MKTKWGNACKFLRTVPEAVIIQQALGGVVVAVMIDALSVLVTMGVLVIAVVVSNLVWLSKK